VLDVTAILARHPGGRRALLRFAAQDATSAPPAPRPRRLTLTSVASPPLPRAGRSEVFEELHTAAVFAEHAEALQVRPPPPPRRGHCRCRRPSAATVVALLSPPLGVRRRQVGVLEGAPVPALDRSGLGEHQPGPGRPLAVFGRTALDSPFPHARFEGSGLQVT
jgi:hypothetical protein